MRLASLAKRPGVVNYLDRMLYKKDGVFRLEEVEICPTSSLVGKSLGQLDLAENMQLIVTEVIPSRHRQFDSDFVPSATHVLQAGEIIIVQGRVENIERLRDVADGSVGWEARSMPQS